MCCEPEARSPAVRHGPPQRDSLSGTSNERGPRLTVENVDLRAVRIGSKAIQPSFCRQSPATWQRTRVCTRTTSNRSQCKPNGSVHCAAQLKSITYLYYLPSKTEPSLVLPHEHPCIPEVAHGRLAVLIACGSYSASEDRAVSIKANVAQVGRAAAVFIVLNGFQEHLPVLLLAAGAYDCKVLAQKGARLSRSRFLRPQGCVGSIRLRR